MEIVSEYHEEKRPSIEIDPILQASMLEISRWAKFMGIIGFIFTGLFLLMGISDLIRYSINGREIDMSGILIKIGGVALVLINTAFIFLAFYPSFLLFKGAVNLKRAIGYSNQQLLQKAFISLKRLFVFQGVMVIIMIILFGALIIFAGVIAGFAAAA